MQKNLVDSTGCITESSGCRVRRHPLHETIEFNYSNFMSHFILVTRFIHLARRYSVLYIYIYSFGKLQEKQICESLPEIHLVAHLFSKGTSEV